MGKVEARVAGKLLKASGIHIESAATSMMTRAVNTCNLIVSELDEMDSHFLNIVQSAALIDRHYGKVTKATSGKEFGLKISPPKLSTDDQT